MRQSPSTSTRTVPSGNFTIFDSRETQPTSCKSSGRGFGDVGIALQHRAEQTVAGDEVVNQLEARPGFDEQRHDRAGKNHDVRKAEDGQRFRQRTRRNARGSLRFFGGARGC